METYNAEQVTIADRFVDGQQKRLNEYSLGSIIGRGSFCKVREVIRHFLDEEGKEVTASYAMKVFKKSTLLNKRFVFYHSANECSMINYMDQVEKEVALWRTQNDSRLVKLYQVIDDPLHNTLYLVMEHCDHGQVMTLADQEQEDEHSVQYIHNPLTANHIQYVFTQICLSIQVLHDQLIAHRDIKIDNILLKSQTDHPLPLVKLADFTISVRVEKEDSLVYDAQGTVGFRAPETVLSTSDGYSPLKADIFSLGVTLFCLLTNGLPFWGESELDTDLLAFKGVLPMEGLPDCPLLLDLLTALINKNALQRPTIHQVLQHGWFK